MASNSRPANERSFLLPSGSGGGLAARVALGLPVVLMLAAIVILTGYCRSLLMDAVAGRSAAGAGFSLALVAGGFLLASSSVILLQSARLAARVAGPELRLVRAMQRIRAGDTSFRVQLRRGDLLSGLAGECNELIEWLNEKSPREARVEADLVELEGIAAHGGQR